jgi:SAM-dependent methyltransferase
VLDVGCGFGLETLRLAPLVQPGGAVSGIDLSAEFIAEAVRRAEAQGLHVDLATGDAQHLPFPDDAFDVTRIERVLIYLDEPDRVLAEMVRVTRPGGTVFCSYTLWLSLWGGHETAPWHFLGGHYAARRYTRRHGHLPKNVYGTSLFAVSAGRVLKWVRRTSDVELVAVLPRYHPWWAWWVVRIPGIREVASWNVALVLRHR